MAHQKRLFGRIVFFMLNPSFDGIKQSLIDEICFTDEVAYQADIKTDLISSKLFNFDFLRTCLDFIVNRVSDFIKTAAS